MGGEPDGEGGCGLRKIKLGAGEEVGREKIMICGNGSQVGSFVFFV